MAGPYQRSSKPMANQREETFQTINIGTSQGVAFNGTSAQSAAFQSTTTLVRLFATQDCFVSIGSNPVAAANTSMFVPGGIIDFIGVQPGQIIAAIQSSQSGTLYITEGA